MLSVNLSGHLIPTKKSAFSFLHTHHLFLNKITNFHPILRTSSIYCLLQSIELNPQTVKDSLDEEDPEQEQELDSYTIDYLVNACGLSESEAIHVTKVLMKKNKRLDMKRAENADDVLDLLREYGFSRTHISSAVRRHPLILMSNPYVTIFPKLDFLSSIMFKGGSYLGDFVSQSPQILQTSLKQKLIPNYNILKGVLDSNHEMIHATMKKSLGILRDNLYRTLVPNVEVLRDAGVSKSRIQYLVVKYPLAVRHKHSKFKQIVVQLEKMEFDPSRIHFIYGIVALARKNKVVWDRSYEVFSELGCSRDEILAAFRTYPLCMLVSEEKVKKVMDCLVNEIRWPYNDIIRKPHLFTFSLEKRIIPRCSVVLFLHSKGLLKKLTKLSTFMRVSEAYFVNRYVTRYAKEVPQVLQIYNGELSFPFNSEK